MELEGKVWKDGKFWLVEVPILDAMTQGKSKKEALKMIEDSLGGLIESYFEDRSAKKLGVRAFLREDDVIGITAKDAKILLSLSLIKQREKSNSTIREVAERLGSKSPNSYAQYEKARVSVTLEKYEELLMAVNPSKHQHIRVGIV
ncbi:MAG TPA: type II toxin-antitoxin system HicB family antitoxin [Rhabdochlamydiaceae bacterium]|nr:type II toxin-antitoxin system HicB family antitoxin [Rhabdochlamydiaceae bacterium]